MSDAPIDLNLRRRAFVEKRIAKAQRSLVLADELEASYAADVAMFLEYAADNRIESEEAKAAAEFADQREINKKVAGNLRVSALEEIRSAQADLDRLKLDGRPG